MTEEQKKALLPVKGCLREALEGEDPGVYVYDGNEWIKILFRDGQRLYLVEKREEIDRDKGKSQYISSMHQNWSE